MNKKYQDSESEQEKDYSPSPEASKIVMPTLKRGEIKNSASVSDSGTSSVVPPSDDDLGIDSYPGSENAVLNKPSCSRYGPENQSTSSIKPLPEIEGSYSNNLKDEQFKRQVLRNLSILYFKLDQLAEDVGRIALKEKREVIVSSSVFLKLNFPLSTEEELHIFENHLADGENYKQVQVELSRIGGSSTKIMVKRLLDKIMSKLGVEYSWIGFKKKRNFSVLLTTKILIDAVMAVHQNSNAAEVETTVKQWLVKCKERIDKENK